MNTYLNDKTLLLRIPIGIVYLWFGGLKLFPGWSPAETLAKNTVQELSLGLIAGRPAILFVAILEVVIGIFLIFGRYKKTTILVTLMHMAFTFTPLFFFSEQSFQIAPLVPTLLGQYIGKNIIIIGALLTLMAKENELRINHKS